MNVGQLLRVHASVDMFFEGSRKCSDWCGAPSTCPCTPAWTHPPSRQKFHLGWRIKIVAADLEQLSHLGQQLGIHRQSGINGRARPKCVHGQQMVGHIARLSAQITCRQTKQTRPRYRHTGTVAVE